MSHHKLENILCVNRRELFARGYFQGFVDTEMLVLPRFHFYPRCDELEADHTVKQIIPYIAIMDDKGHIMHYQRGKSGGEGRLHAKRSIGFGGHINVTDEDQNFNSLSMIARKAAMREIKEELGFDVTGKLNGFGLINDDTNDVGRVHLGMLYIVNLTADELTALLTKAVAEQDIEDLDCNNIATMLPPHYTFSTLETWSQIFIQAISTLIRNPIHGTADHR